MNHKTIKTLLLSASIAGIVSYSAAAQAQNYQCHNYLGTAIADAACDHFSVAKPTITCYTAPTTTTPTTITTSSGNDRDSGRDNSIDVNGDGIGDYSTSHAANQAGHGYSSQRSVDNCSGCSNSARSRNGTGNTPTSRNAQRSNSSGGNDGGSSSGGGCFVTTAVTKSLNEPDNGPTLTTLRHMRDYFTIHNWRGQDRIQIYYDIAPQIVETINQRADQDQIWNSINSDWIQPIVALINSHNYEEADTLYADMVVALTLKYLMGNIANDDKQKLFLHAIKIT